VWNVLDFELKAGTRVDAFHKGGWTLDSPNRMKYWYIRV